MSGEVVCMPKTDHTPGRPPQISFHSARLLARIIMAIGWPNTPVQGPCCYGGCGQGNPILASSVLPLAPEARSITPALP
jgi:hypothetical protein